MLVFLCKKKKKKLMKNMLHEKNVIMYVITSEDVNNYHGLFVRLVFNLKY